MVEIILNISFGITIVALLLAFIRMIIGPTVADRVVSLDVMTIISISIIVYIGSLAGRIIYLDVAMVYALMSFLGVVAVARYLERGL